MENQPMNLKPLKGFFAAVSALALVAQFVVPKRIFMGVSLLALLFGERQQTTV
jgi:hypothetical protein